MNDPKETAIHMVKMHGSRQRAKAWAERHHANAAMMGDKTASAHWGAVVDVFASWTYLPGDYIDEVVLVNPNVPREIGSVVLQWYTDDCYRVAKFLPGVSVWTEGDTPKIEPEEAVFRNTELEGRAIFMRFVHEAGQDGWEIFKPSEKNQFSGR